MLEKIIIMALVCSMTFCANAFTLGGLEYKLCSSEDIDLSMSTWTPRLSENAVMVSSCDKHDINNLEIPCFVSDRDNTYTVEGVDYEAFKDCRQLNSVVVGDSIKFISDGAFSYSPIKKLVWNAEECIMRTAYMLDAFSINEDGTYCTTWRDLRDLPFEQVEEVEIGENVKCLPNVFLAHSKIKTLTIPESVTRILEYSFSGCFELESVHVKAKDPSQITLEFQAFNETAENCTLYVPKGSAGLYRQADQWKEFKNIVEEGEEVDNPYDLNHDGQVDVTDVDIIIDAVLGRR